jgi:hypothetical protein
MKPVSPLPLSPVAVPSQTEARPDPARRRFVIGGLVAAPLLVTLAASPAWARQGQGSLGNYGSTTG